MIYDHLFPPHGVSFCGTREEFEERCDEKEEELGRRLTRAEVIVITQKITGEKEMSHNEEFRAKSNREYSPIRTFDTGATRDDDSTKPDYEGFLSPLVIVRYGEYMAKHRKQSDGKMRESDNWQKGIPLAQYLKSLWRHLVDLWSMHREIPPFRYREEDEDDEIEEALCAVLFNASGYLHEYLKARSAADCDRNMADCDQKKAEALKPEDVY